MKLRSGRVKGGFASQRCGDFSSSLIQNNSACTAAVACGCGFKMCLTLKS